MKKLLKLFMRKSCKSKITELKPNKKRKSENVKWKDCDNCFISWSNKRAGVVWNDSIFPKPCQHSSGNINVELDLSDYAT